MFVLKSQDQGLITLSQQDYLPILVDSFLIDRRAQGLSSDIIELYTKKLQYFLKYCENVKIWECWTEIPLHKGIPDALAWGTCREREMLFWLEVDSGKSSRKTMEHIYQQRIRRVHQHAFTWDLPIVFCILGPDWVVKFHSRRLAMIGHDWRYFGKLPLFEFGAWHNDLHWSHFLRATRKGIKLPFNPNQYPRKPKDKIRKVHKPKSAKPKFQSPIRINLN
jgi:hypothetical protein